MDRIIASCLLKKALKKESPPTLMLGMENGSSHCGGHWAEENEDKIRTLLMPTKINCRQIKGLNKRTDTTKLLREKLLGAGILHIE